MSPSRSAAVLLALLAGSAWAQTPTNEASEAAFTDPVTECTPANNFAPVAAAVAASSFPAIWLPVQSLLPNDSEGAAKFAAMSGSIPNIAPKGVLGVLNETIEDTYPAADPDCWWTVATCVTPKAPGVNPDIASVPEPNTLGYGFDDGPNCSHNAFYDFLSEQKQKATMYYIGSNVIDWPYQAQRAITDGHEICVHTWSHRMMTAFTNEQAFGELWYTIQAIKLVTGVTPTCWRPPLGDVDDRIRYIAQQLGLFTIMWKYNSNDWEVSAGSATPAQVQANYNALVADAQSGAFDTVGAIILTHELNNYTMQTAIDNYKNLSAAFKHIVPVGVALNQTQPYVESNYTQQTFEQYINNEAATPDINNEAATPGNSTGSDAGTGTAAAPGSSSTGSGSKSGSASSGEATGSSSAVSVSSFGLTSVVLGLCGIVACLL
uniref:chitin deacetylase n=1 Tax=Mycena chlorophos TaxID=658473 RepID=A0ABQ0M7F2_MYCCL|nr:carbohydrate esterase family 4 protein [Mycena chlorophos]